MPQTQPCKNCSQPFQITQRELDFYKNHSPIIDKTRHELPHPTCCPTCRQQKRMAWRNERTLYNRKCDLSDKPIISSHPGNTPFPVYEYDEWWSEKWNPTDYAQDIDFNKPFFEQFSALVQQVPRLNLSNGFNENCAYVNYTNYSKDCYLLFGSHKSEKCGYSWRIHNCYNCYDCSQLDRCKHCYECTDCDNCYDLLHSRNCQNCIESEYLDTCRSCQDCFLCTNLVHKKHNILNKQYKPQEYKEKLHELKSLSNKALLEKLEELRLKHPRKATNTINCENSTGNHLLNCKNCHNTYTAKECEDCTNLFIGENTTDCLDCDITGWPAELCYEGTSTCVQAIYNYFSSLCWTCSDIYYCDSCFNSNDLFGCIGFKHNSYCILNKQYSHEEYFKLVPRLIEHMQKTGEWGEFFPISISPFPLENTIAMDFCPPLSQPHNNPR